MKLVGGKVCKVCQQLLQGRTGQGREIHAENLEQPRLLTINSDGWVRDADNSALVRRVVHNYNLKYNDVLGAYKRRKFK